MNKNDNVFGLFLLAFLTSPIWGLLLAARLTSPTPAYMLSEAEKGQERERTLQVWVETIDDLHPQWSERDKLYAAAYRAKEELNERGIDPGPGFAALESLVTTQ